MKYIITEKQLKTLRKYMKSFINESEIKLMSPRERMKSAGNTYGHTDINYQYAPEGLSDEEAVEHLRNKFRGYPMWTFQILKDPDNERVYAYYELDTSG
jgi:hypothetical protein